MAAGPFPASGLLDRQKSARLLDEITSEDRGRLTAIRVSRGWTSACCSELRRGEHEKKFNFSEFKMLKRGGAYSPAIAVTIIRGGHTKQVGKKPPCPATPAFALSITGYCCALCACLTSARLVSLHKIRSSVLSYYGVHTMASAYFSSSPGS